MMYCYQVIYLGLTTVFPGCALMLCISELGLIGSYLFTVLCVTFVSNPLFAAKSTTRLFESFYSMPMFKLSTTWKRKITKPAIYSFYFNALKMGTVTNSGLLVKVFKSVS
jgi:hypothetical protein